MSAERPRSFLVGLIGQGVGPSLSPEMHEREAVRQHLRYVYKVIDLPAGEITRDRLERLLGAAAELGFDGLNVTHPVKQAMVPLVDELAPEVTAIGALNTVLLRTGTTVGHNTDVSGFARAFAEAMPDADLDRIVLLGAGGAGTAVAHGLTSLGARRIQVVDPDGSRARTLAESVARLGIEVETVPPTRDAVGGALAEAAGLVNASPMGMAAHPGSPVPVELLRPGLWVADIVYRPLMTPLLAGAEALGCTVLNGAGMAVHQAADAFELITGCPADRAAMFRDFDDLVAREAPATSPTPPSRDDTGERNR